MDPKIGQEAVRLSHKRIPMGDTLVERMHEPETKTGARNGYYMACMDLLPVIENLRPKGEWDLDAAIQKVQEPFHRPERTYTKEEVRDILRGILAYAEGFNSMPASVLAHIKDAISFPK